MSEHSPPILKITWPAVLLLFGAELAALALVAFGVWYLVFRESDAADADKEIRQAFALQVEAWNRGDLDGFMELYWKDEKLTFFSGDEVTTGWQKTFDRYRKKYQSEGKEMGRLTFSEIEVTGLTADAATARGRWRLKRTKDEPAGLFTLIFRRIDGHWRIVHDHTSMKNP